MSKENCFKDELEKCPEPFRRWLFQDNHRSEKGGISCTQLISPLRAFVLQMQNNGGTKSVNSRLLAAIGTATHKAIESTLSTDDRNELGIEQEVYMWLRVDEFTLSGTADLVCDGEIWDYKTTSVRKFKETPKEWVEQLNIYAYMYRRTMGKDVKKLQILIIARDFVQSKATYQAEYPKMAFKVVDIPLWDDDKTDAFIRERIAKAKAVLSGEKPLPLCTNEEMWVDDRPYAVMRTGQKNAIKLYASKEEANKHAEDLALKPFCVIAKGGKKILKRFETKAELNNEEAKSKDDGRTFKKIKFTVQERQANPIKCAYCDASEFCEQFKQFRETFKTPEKHNKVATNY